jgi:hypothetical protein
MNTKNIAGAVVPVNRPKLWREGERIFAMSGDFDREL